MSKFNFGAVALLLAVICGDVGLAQVETKVAPKQDETKRVATKTTTLDQPFVEFFASKIVLCNNGEIHKSQFAAGKATNNDVKQFADMLAKDHAKFNEQLKPFNASYGVEPITSTSATAQKSTAQGAVKADTDQNKDEVAAKEKPAEAKAPAIIKTTTETSLRTGDNATLQRLFEICQAAHDNGMAACKEKMAKISGHEFDKAFIGSQAVAHGMMLSELKTLESRSTGEFQSAIREMRTSVESHLAKAEGLCKTLDAQKDATPVSNK